MALRMTTTRSTRRCTRQPPTDALSSAQFDVSKDSMLFVIECNATMLRDDRDRTKLSQAVDALDDGSEDGAAPQYSLVLRALKLVHKTIRRKLKQSPTDKIGILLFNVVR